MKAFNATLLILVLLYINILSAEKASGEEINIKTGSISGKIMDINGNGLPGVNVYLQNTTLGVSTDKEGEFKISNVQIGTYKIIASMVGYEPGKQNIEIVEDKNLHLEFTLRETFYETSSVVVTGTASQYLYEESPVKTEVVPRKLIEQTRACNLAEAIGLQTGVRVENNCQNCNFTQVRILGFDGKYSQILIDGDPIISSLAGVYALEQFPEEMISQLEIVKGGGSSLYGAGAIAGTINIITQRPKLNQTKVSFQSQSIEGQLDNELGTVAGLVTNDGHTGAYIYGSARKRNEYDRNDDGFTELGRLNNETIGFNWFYRPAVNNQFEISLHRIHEERRGGNNLDLPQHEADIAEWLDHLRWGGKAKWQHNITSTFDYNLFYSFSDLKRDSYYGGLTDDDEDGIISDDERLSALSFYGNAKNTTQVTGGRANLTLGNQKITAGFEYYIDALKDNSVKDVRYHIDGEYTNLGAYLQDDISLLDNHLDLVIGARIDKHSELSDPVISPRINVMFDALEELALRFSYSTGFRAPQTFDEDLHIESLAGDQRVVRNSDDLTEESSTTISAGFEFQGFIGDVAFLIGGTGFYTSLKDAFSEEPLGESGDGLVLWQRINTDGAIAKGFELDFGLKPVSKLELRAGLTYKDSKYDSQQEIFDGQFTDKFLRTPDTYGYFRVSYDPSERLNIFSAIRYTGSMIVPNEAIEEIVEPEDTFFEFDLGLSYQPPFFDYFGGKVNLGVKNLFDAYQDDLGVGVSRDPAYVYGPQLPRRIYFGIETSF